MFDKFVDFDKTAGVENPLYSLSCRKFALFVLFGDCFFPAALQDFRPASEQFLAELIDCTIRHAVLSSL
jgi:hypothetical protein